MMRPVHIVLAAALAVAGCSGGNSPVTGTQQGAFSEIREAAQGAKRTTPAKPPRVTRALLDSLTVASLEIVAEDTGSTAYLVPLTRRTDAAPGRVDVWRTADGGQVALRSGVVTNTRGLGNDLASAHVFSTLRGLRNASGGGQRALYLRNDLGKQEVLVQNCRIDDLGPVTVSIVERNLATRHLRETCNSAFGTNANDYWIDRSTGTMWQSRQWLGPELGYFRIRLLRQ